MNNKIRRLCIDIVLIILYTGISLALGSLSFGLIQIRIAEVLQVVCLKDKHYVLPLTIACFLTNAIGFSLGMSFIPLDIIVGTLATLISCLLIYQFKTIVSKKQRPYLSLLMPVIINGVFIGLLYTFVLFPLSSIGLALSYFGYTFISIAISEFVSCFLLGLIVYKPVLRILEHYDSSDIGYNK